MELPRRISVAPLVTRTAMTPGITGIDMRLTLTNLVMRSCSSSLINFAIRKGLFRDFCIMHAMIRRVTALMELLNTLLSDKNWPQLALGLRFLLGLIVLRVLWLVFRNRMTSYGKHARTPFTTGVILTMFLVLFSGALIHQASWQLFGLSRPKFVAFMQKYDRRQFNPAHSISRGKILDRKQRVIAYSLKKGDQVTRHYRLGDRREEGEMCCHIVGYAHPRYGMAGLEGAAHVELIGGGLNSVKEWQSLGRKIIHREDAIQGEDLVLTLDVELQKVAYKHLKGRQGAAVLMHVHDGDLLAIASAPTFNPNRIAEDMQAGVVAGSPYLNRATQGLYPPGSTYKVVVGAAALAAGTSLSIDCPADGFTTSPIYPKIRDHEYYHAKSNGGTWTGHGVIDLNRALVKSSNVYFAKLAVQLGHQAMQTTAQGFGLNQPITLYETSSDKLQAMASRYPALNRDDQYGLAQVGIGQGKLVVTPLQMCMIAAAVANDGMLAQPRIDLNQSPKNMQRSMSAVHAQTLGVMMRNVVSSGTGRGMANIGFVSAGKTGTAENSHGEAHGWYIGFAPYENPVLAVCVVI
ncbi:MAG: peptidoglycan glycosyltransferase, partial [Verrucomicrobiales bacterium]